MADKPGGKKKSPDNPFTVDHNADFTQEMPSITKLLNRKKLAISGGTRTDTTGLKSPAAPAVKTNPTLTRTIVPAYTPNLSNVASQPVIPKAQIPPQSPALAIAPPPSKAPQKQQPVIVDAPPHPALSPSDGIALAIVSPDSNFEPTLGTAARNQASAAITTANAAAAPVARIPVKPVVAPKPPVSANLTAIPGGIPGSVKVQPSRRARASAGEVERLDPGALRLSQDPLSKGLVQMVDRGAASALFLALITPGAALPQLLAKSGCGPVERFVYWKGWRWDSSLTPQIWNQVVKMGALEFPPTDSQVGATLRTALGAGRDEYLLIVRAGSTSNLAGVIFFTGKKSMIANYTELRPIFSSIQPVVGFAAAA